MNPRTCLSLILAAVVVAGCDSTKGASPTPVYDQPRDAVFDAMQDALDASYDLDEVDRRAGKITTHWDMSRAGGVFSQDGMRSRAEGKIVEADLPGSGKDARQGYRADIKVFVETNTDKDNPMDPYADTANWRSEGTDPRQAQEIIDYIDTLLGDFGPSDDWRRENERP